MLPAGFCLPSRWCLAGGNATDLSATDPKNLDTVVAVA
jgi:hypothetical protein